MYWNPESVFDDACIEYYEEYNYEAEEKGYDKHKECDLFKNNKDENVVVEG